ncbi:hypothetical protein BD408DRAFT_413235 [Parasitella parasitica]|nr:hypothetical protein BD408DRAFT_413235 [Parasitella parasitica]
MHSQEEHHQVGETTALLPTTAHDSTHQGSERKDYKYYCIWLWRFCIFAITGSLSVHVTKFVLALFDCPRNTWYYYVGFFFAELFVYTVLIVLIGTVLFQWRFFCLVAFKMWSWILPRKPKVWCYERLHSHRITL